MLDTSGGVIPSAKLVLTNKDTGVALALESDAKGEFYFMALQSGTYSLQCNVPGFGNAFYGSIGVGFNQTRDYAVTMEVAEVTETITVGGEPADRYRYEHKTSKKEAREAQAEHDFRQQAGLLKQGLVGGVRPVPVTIPETGKVLFLAGALPPPRVTAEISVKAPKR